MKPFNQQDFDDLFGLGCLGNLVIAAVLLLGLGAAVAAGVEVPDADRKTKEAELTETLTLIGAGARLLGNASRPRSHPNVADTQASFVAWRGPKTEPSIVLLGAHARIGNFGISGRAKWEHELNAKARLAILIDQPKRTGIGNGKHHFEPIVIEDYTNGIQFGSSAGIANCDCCTFERVDFQHCSIGARSVNSMSMGHTFDYVRNMATRDDGLPILDEKGEPKRDEAGEIIRENPVGFYYQEGGDLVVKKYDAMGPQTVLLVDGGSGSNKADWEFRSIKFDQQAGPHGKLLEMRSHNTARFIFRMSCAFDGYNDGGRSGDYFIEARSPAVVTLSGRNYQHRTLRWESKPGQSTRIIVEDAELACEPWELFDVANSVGACDVTVTDTCTRFGTGQKAPAYQTTLNGKAE